MRARRFILVATLVALAAALVAPATRATDVTVSPEDVQTDNCWPFGYGASTGESWQPYYAAFYRNIPRFVLKRGDELAFDLSAPNETVVELDIALARATTNGGATNAKPFKQVVSNSQTPEDANGDGLIGNFELAFDSEAKFKFAGGGLIIRFSDPSDAYAEDDGCNPVLVGGGSGDPSGFFVQRAYLDADGVSPWTSGDPDTIPSFRITDRKPPKTKIKGGPKGTTDNRDAKFRLKSDEFDSKFKCKLDGEKLRRCRKKLKLKNLDPGEHILKVKAKDPAGNRDRSAAKRKWTVLP